MGDLFEATPDDLISRVYLEEKLFETWQHGRTALIGDGEWDLSIVATSLDLRNERAKC